MVIMVSLCQYGSKCSVRLFSMYEDDNRIVRFGDIITVWSPNTNKFWKADALVGNKL